MGSIVRPNTLTPGTLADATEVNENEELIYSEFNGGIDDVNVRASAAIQGSKLANAPNGVPTAKINDGAVNTLQLADDAVTKDKLGPLAVLKEHVKVTISSKLNLGSPGAVGVNFPGSGMTPATPSISNCIPLGVWITRGDGTPPVPNAEVTMTVDNTGAIFFNVRGPDLSLYTLNFAYIPVS